MSQRGYCPIPTATKGADLNHGKAPDSAPDTHMETRERDVWVISTMKAYLCRRPISTCFFMVVNIAMHIVNFPSKQAPILCKHTCIH